MKITQPTANIAIVLLAVFMLVPGIGTSAHASEVKSLQYDEKGRIIGITKKTVGGKTSAGKSGDDATRDDAANGFGNGPSSFDPDNEFEEGEVVVVDPPADFAAKARIMGYYVIENVRLGNLGIGIMRLQIPRGTTVKDAIRDLSAEFPGITVDANVRFDPSSGTLEQSNPRVIGGWTKLSDDCGSGVRLGMIDSGIDVSHPALDGQKLEYMEFYKPDRKPGPPDHGTGIAAMLVGKAEWGGLLPGAHLYAANMFEINEKGEKVGSAIGLIKSIDWIASKNVHAVNMSVAGGDNKVVRKALEIAKKQNLLLVASVGNWGRSDKPAYPAAYSEVVAVTALKGQELIYSHANTGGYVDFAAPGVGLYVAKSGGGGKLESGTSYATPYITVIAAVLNKSGMASNADKFRAALTKATRDLGKPGKDDVFGMGAVRAMPSCK